MPIFERRTALFRFFIGGFCTAIEGSNCACHVGDKSLSWIANGETLDSLRDVRVNHLGLTAKTDNIIRWKSWNRVDAVKSHIDGKRGWVEGRKSESCGFSWTRPPELKLHLSFQNRPRRARFFDKKSRRGLSQSRTINSLYFDTACSRFDVFS